jgi:hypothetical protein
MRFIHIYLIAYFVLVLGAGLALFQAGVLSRVNPLWVVIGGSLVVGLAVLLAVTSDKPVMRD